MILCCLATQSCDAVFYRARGPNSAAELRLLLQEKATGVQIWLHIWARVLGHMTSLSCSLLLLPASKNSVWSVPTLSAYLS